MSGTTRVSDRTFEPVEHQTCGGSGCPGCDFRGEIMREIPKPPPSPRELAREVILRGIGVERVARWCEVEENTVYQWLKRGTDDKPIPVGHAVTIHNKGLKNGLQFELASLAPTLEVARPSRFHPHPEKLADA